MAYSTDARRLVEAAGGVFVRNGKGTHQIYRINTRTIINTVYPWDGQRRQPGDSAPAMKALKNL
jgi:hypothetical protein